MTVVPVIADGASDDSDIINATLADPSTTVAELPPGTIALGSAIVIPSGKTLAGAGRELTTLQALPTFAHNIVVASAIGARGVAVRDMVIDGNRVGLGGGSSARLNGLQMTHARRFTINRVDVRNCTGYGHYVVGDTNDFETMAGDGTWEDCRAANCQIHFEQMYSENITLINCHSRNGDGDLDCHSWFHPMTGSRDIVYIGCSARGLAGAGVEVTANVRDIHRVKFVACDIHVTGTTAAFVTSAGVGRTYGLELIGTRILSDEGIGAQLHNTQAFATQSFITGAGEGLQVSNGTTMIAVGTEVLGATDPSGTSIAIGIKIDGTSLIRWTGGRIEGRGPPRLRKALFGATTRAEISDTTQLIGAPRIFKVQEMYGDAAFTRDGPVGAYVNILLPAAVLDRSKGHLDFTIRKNTDTYLADRIAASWSYLDNRNIRVRIAGDGTLDTTASLSFHFVEWGERP